MPSLAASESKAVASFPFCAASYFVSTKCVWLIDFYGFSQTLILDPCHKTGEGDVWVYMELMEISLADLYRKISPTPFPEPILAQFSVSIFEGLKYLKTKLNVMHRDVKPSNSQSCSILFASRFLQSYMLRPFHPIQFPPGREYLTCLTACSRVHMQWCSGRPSVANCSGRTSRHPFLKRPFQVSR
jgi:hypothetical protein